MYGCTVRTRRGETPRMVRVQTFKFQLHTFVPSLFFTCFLATLRTAVRWLQNDFIWLMMKIPRDLPSPCRQIKSCDHVQHVSPTYCYSPGRTCGMNLRTRKKWRLHWRAFSELDDRPWKIILGVRSTTAVLNNALVLYTELLCVELRTVYSSLLLSVETFCST